MSKLRLAACALALFALPRCAHDPLDNVSGEEEFVRSADPEDKPKSAKRTRQEGEFKHESEEMELAQFHANEEKEIFLRDKAETREVKDAQHQRDLVHGRKSNTTAPAQMSKPKGEEPKAEKTDKPEEAPAPSADAHGNSSSTVTVTKKPKAAAKPAEDEAAAKDDGEEQGREDFDKKMKKDKKKKKGGDEFDQ